MGGGRGYIYWGWSFGGLRGLLGASGGLLVGLDGVVLPSAVATAMGCCQWACRIGWY